MITYENGNARITLTTDGTRTIEFDGELNLVTPLNLDIRVTNRCSFGFNPKTNSAVCSFCHESQRTDGNECDFEMLKNKLESLHPGIELAIGSNMLTEGLYSFIEWAYEKGFIVNLTVNMGHLTRDFNKLKKGIENGFIKGLGVSYRSSQKWNVPTFILDYNNTVFHVIVGIDLVHDVLNLREKGVKKVLLLGEKDFGFNLGNVDTTSIKHKHWFWYVRKLFDVFDVVSFDNLAIEQLKIKRFFTEDMWKEFYNGERSFYINAVDGYFSPSSRNPQKIDWNTISIGDYFKTLNK